MRALFVGFLAFACLNPAFADIGLQPALQTCAVLKDTKLNSRGLVTAPDGKQTCASQVRSISPSAASTLGFSMESRDEVASKVTLTLRVQPGEDDQATQELIKAAQRLSIRTLGKSMPHSIHQSIAAATPSRTSVGTGVITVSRGKAPDGKGYLLLVSME